MENLGPLVGEEVRIMREEGGMREWARREVRVVVPSFPVELVRASILRCLRSRSLKGVWEWVLGV